MALTQDEFKKLQEEQTITPTVKSAASSAALPQTGGEKPSYQQSGAVQNAYNALQQYQAQKPQDYQSQYSTQIDSLLNQVLGRQAFSYDMNADPAYQQYKAQYTQLGNQAMRDTMGQAAALTGGYGNSYASTAGNQAYQSYLNQLNSAVPSLYAQALQQYQNQGAQMTSNLSALQNQEQIAYGQHQDAVNNYYTGLNSQLSQYDTLYDQDYGAYQDLLNQYNADQQLAFNQQQAEQEQANWQTEWDYNTKKKR